MRQVTIVIPNWNGRRLLKVCLASLHEQTYHSFTTIVVDNGSTDDSCSYVQKHYPAVQLIRLHKNLGFAEAVNLGIKASDTPYIALLNNDTKLNSFWLARLHAYLKAHPAISAVCGKMRFMQQPTRIDNAGDSVNSVGQADGRGSGELDTGQYDKIEEVFSVTGGGSLWRREVFEQVGMFDTEFFAFFEDVDMGFRMRSRGLRCMYVPQALLYHQRGATAKGDRKLMMYLHFRNTWMIVIKHYPLTAFFSRGRWWKMPLVYLRTMRHLVTSGYAKEVMRVQIYFLTHMRPLLQSRAACLAERTVPFASLEPCFGEKQVRFLWKKQVLSF